MVTDLLQSTEQSDSERFLEGPESYPAHLISDFSNPPDSYARESSLIGKTIGAYKITELLWHGGMGSVFLAEYLLREVINIRRERYEFPHERIRVP